MLVSIRLGQCFLGANDDHDHGVSEGHIGYPNLLKGYKFHHITCISLHNIQHIESSILILVGYIP